MRPGHVTLILNPGSCSGRGRRHLAAWLAAFREAGVSTDCLETTSLEHARDLAVHACQTDAVLACGGDGTVNAVLDGVVGRGECGPPMGVLYAGTSPDFCRFQQIPLDPPAAVATVVRGQVRSVDVGRIQFRGFEGRESRAHFGCSVNVGIGAQVAARASRWRRHLGDGCGTGLAVLTSLPGPHADLEVTTDAEEPYLLRTCCNLSIAKNPLIASGLRMNTDLRCDDGRLALLGIAGHRLPGLIRLLPSLYTGTVTGKRGVFFRYGHRVTVCSGRPVGVEFDGDPRGTLPISVDIVPRALKLLVSASHDTP